MEGRGGPSHPSPHYFGLEAPLTIPQQYPWLAGQQRSDWSCGRLQQIGLSRSLSQQSGSSPTRS